MSEIVGGQVNAVDPSELTLFWEGVMDSLSFVRAVGLAMGVFALDREK